ncbi:hypothetical protein [Croceicoccus marinus]|nr:hypothetical protein [Croceicoccus marinus]
MSARVSSVRMLATSLAAFIFAIAAPAFAGELAGPARFCGYSPIIDLIEGETVVTLQGGIHGGSFRWEGAFGSLEVNGIGWASRPKGRIVSEQTDARPARFAQRRTDGRYQIAIWNGRHGAAYFTSPNRFTRQQIEAIERVRLFKEGETPEGCNLRTVFSWE